MRYLFIYIFLLLAFNSLHGQTSKDNYHDLSESFYLSFLDKNPDHLETLEILGDLYFSNGKWEQSLNFFKKLVNICPKNANYHFKFGGVLAILAREGSKLKALGYLNQAKKAFSSAETLDPNFIQLYWAQVELYTQLPTFLGGSYEKAWFYSNKIEALSKIDGYFSKAYIYQQNEDLENFEYFTNKGVDELFNLECYETDEQITNNCFFNNNINYQIGIGFNLFKSNFRQALIFLKKYIQNYTIVDRYSLDIVYCIVSEIQLKSGDTKSAIMSLDSALNINPNYEKAKVMKKEILKKFN